MNDEQTKPCTESPFPIDENFVQFSMSVSGVIRFDAKIQSDLISDIQPKWRIYSFGVNPENSDGNLYRITAQIHPEDLPHASVTQEEMRAFRDLLVSLISFIGMTPLQIIDSGCFRFPLGNRKFKATRLDPSSLVGSTQPIMTLEPLIKGFTLDQKYLSALNFFWQSISNRNHLYRFINIAIAIELIVRCDSSILGGSPPKCSNPQCDFVLESCPSCSSGWRKIPNTLRERAAFLITDNETLGQFIRARNTVFHGTDDDLHGEFAKVVAGLNIQLLIYVRNYLGRIIRLPDIEMQDISLLVQTPGMSMSVFFTHP